MPGFRLNSLEVDSFFFENREDYMLNWKKWFVLFAAFFLGLAVQIVAPKDIVKTASAKIQVAADVTEETTEETLVRIELICAEDLWKAAYQELMYGTMTSEKLAALALAEVKQRDLELMTNATDHIVNYHGKRFAITDDEYKVLLQIVEAEATDEDVMGKMLVANVVLNRMEIGFGGTTISEVVFAKGQFEPVSNGRIFNVTPTETTIEAVERVLDGEDESRGALYFMARAMASRSGIRWFDNNLQFLFKHGNHEFFKEKDQ